MAPAAKDSPTTEDSVQHWKSYVETHANTTENGLTTQVRPGKKRKSSYHKAWFRPVHHLHYSRRLPE
ncbi:unnamed protein product [Fusarium graminearum]|nr:unnamed protein product [Fusarium graminearum]